MDLLLNKPKTTILLAIVLAAVPMVKASQYPKELAADEEQAAKWLPTLSEKICAHREFKAVATSLRNETNETVSVLLHVTKNGSVDSLKFTGQAPSAALQKDILELLQRAEPYSSPPNRLALSSTVVVTFQKKRDAVSCKCTLNRIVRERIGLTNDS